MSHVTLQKALSALPPASQEQVALLFSHGTLDVKLYAPRGEDLQTPHTRDEVYLIQSGHGTFFNGEASHPFHAGDMIFVAAGVPHRFTSFTDDFVTWVLFYGPQGGEADR